MIWRRWAFTVLTHNCHTVLILVTVLILLSLTQEKQDKVALLAEMAHLRENNQRLQEESHSASEQLRKFSQLLSSTSDRKWSLTLSLCEERKLKPRAAVRAGEVNKGGYGSFLYPSCSLTNTHSVMLTLPFTSLSTQDWTLRLRRISEENDGAERENTRNKHTLWSLTGRGKDVGILIF